MCLIAQEEKEEGGWKQKRNSTMSNHCYPQLNVWRNISDLQEVQNRKRSHTAWILIGQELRQVEAMPEKNLTLAEDCWISHGPRTTSKFLYPEHKACLGVYQGTGLKIESSKSHVEISPQFSRSMPPCPISLQASLGKCTCCVECSSKYRALLFLLG